MDEFCTKPMHFLFTLILGLVAYIWKDYKKAIETNQKKLDSLEDKIEAHHYTKDEVNERIGFAVNPIHDSMSNMAEALAENSRVLSTHTEKVMQIHADLQILKETTVKKND